MGNKDDKGREIIDLGEVREEDIEIFESPKETPPFSEDSSPFNEEPPPFGGDSSPFNEEPPPFGGDSPPFGDQIVDEEVPVFEKEEDSKELENTIEKVLELENTLSQLDSSMMVVKKINEETNEKVTGMEDNIMGLMGVYEKITNKMNPFGEKEIHREEGVKDVREAVSAKTEEDQVFIDEIGEVKDTGFQFTEKNTVESESDGALLEELNNEPSSIIILLKWLDFLLQKAGSGRLLDTLEFYENLGWISSNIKEKMIKFTGGLNKDNITENRGEGLRIEDHAISLFFISQIQGYDISSSVYPSDVANLKELGIIDE